MSRSQEFLVPYVGMNSIHPWLPADLNPQPLQSQASRQAEREVYAKQWEIPRDTVLVNWQTGKSTTVGELDAQMHKARSERLLREERQRMVAEAVGQEVVAGECEVLAGKEAVVDTEIIDSTGALAVARVVAIAETEPVFENAAA